jgi:hypothetical protein
VVIIRGESKKKIYEKDKDEKTRGSIDCRSRMTTSLGHSRHPQPTAYGTSNSVEKKISG